MKALNEYIIEHSDIFEGAMKENQLPQILKKIDKWNTVENWMKYEKKNGGDLDEIDEDYFYTEIALCEHCVSMLNYYLDQDRDEVSSNGQIDLGLLSKKFVDDLTESYENGDLEALSESDYFSDWEDYITIFEIAWSKVTKQPFFIEL